MNDLELVNTPLFVCRDRCSSDVSIIKQLEKDCKQKIEVRKRSPQMLDSVCHPVIHLHVQAIYS